MFVGVWVAALLAWPDLRFDAAWSSFGRLRPVHTSGVIFGFGGNALIATSFYVMQRTIARAAARPAKPMVRASRLQPLLHHRRQRLPDGRHPVQGIRRAGMVRRHLAGHRLGRSTSSSTSARSPAATSRTSTSPNWYYLSFVLVVAMLHIFNNLAVPASFTGAKSYSAFSGVQDAMTQWWYGHNAVAFFLTTGFLAMLYYFMPKRAQRPIYSYRLSILSFWGIVFFYIWVGLAPSALHRPADLGADARHDVLGHAAGAVLGHGGQCADDAERRLAQGARRRDPALHDDRRGLLRAVHLRGLVPGDPAGQLALSHYTDWTIGHVHAGTMGWVSLIIFGSIYAVVPVLWRRETMYSWRLVESHFWIALAGTVIYVFSMWNSGIIQGLMWRTYTEAGTLKYSFVDSLVAMHPYYIARAFGGLLFLIGALICLYNV